MHVPLEKRINPITSCVNLLATHEWRGNLKQGHNYCICTEYEQLLVFTRISVITHGEHYFCTEWQGIQLFSTILLFLMIQVTSDFQRFSWNWVVSVPTEGEINSQQHMKRLLSQSLSDYVEVTGLFPGLAVHHYICQLSFIMHKDMMIHFYVPPHISL